MSPNWGDVLQIIEKIILKQAEGLMPIGQEGRCAPLDVEREPADDVSCTVLQGNMFR